MNLEIGISMYPAAWYNLILMDPYIRISQIYLTPDQEVSDIAAPAPDTSLLSVSGCLILPGPVDASSNFKD